MRLLIKVTKEILEKSKMCGRKASDNTGANCAIALAVRDVWPEAWVYHEKIHTDLFGRGNAVFIPLPYEAIAFIKHFDSLEIDPEARTKMPPISFYVEVPESVIEEIGISEIERIVANSNTLEIA